MPSRTVEQSWELYDRAIEVIPMAVQTHSKSPREALRGTEPCFMVKGKGCRVWDLDGNEYIDFRYGMGPITLGYCFPAVDEAVRRQLEDGILFCYSHPLEVEVAERLVQIIPCAERVRFLKTGGEAMAAAHRMARAFTGRDMLLTCGYHGWINTVSRPGVPDVTRSTYQSMPWADISPYREAFESMPDQIAAVSVACGYPDMDKGDPFLSELRALTEEHGSLLIFDEIVTGFRLRRGGAQEFFGVTPDLAVFAKGISNGMPLSCYLGRADIMDSVKDVTISSTFGGESLSLAAAKAVLDTYEKEDVVGTLWARGKQLHDGFNNICRELDVPAYFRGYPPLGQMIVERSNSSELLLRLQEQLIKRGIIPYSVYYSCFSHTESDIDLTLTAMREGLTEMVEQGHFE